MKNLLKAKSEFRKKGIALISDKTKSGSGGSWKFSGEDNLVKTIQQPLTECGLEVVSTIEYSEPAKTDTIKVTLYHVETGEHISSSITMPSVTPRQDKNGNPMYLDAEIERGKQFGYWSRTLTMRILGLSDIDPEDINNRPVDMSDDAVEARQTLDGLISKTKDTNATQNWVKNTYKVNDISKLTLEQVKHASSVIAARVSQDENNH